LLAVHSSVVVAQSVGSAGIGDNRASGAGLWFAWQLADIGAEEQIVFFRFSSTRRVAARLTNDAQLVVQAGVKGAAIGWKKKKRTRFISMTESRKQDQEADSTPQWFQLALS
jgi:hypothetical protein